MTSTFQPWELEGNGDVFEWLFPEPSQVRVATGLVEEAATGQVRAGDVHHLVVPSSSTPDQVKGDHDSALRWALANARVHAYVRGDPFAGGTRFEVFCWNGPPLAAVDVVEFDTTADICTLVVNGGSAVYVPSRPVRPVLRWVSLPRARAFYRLPTTQRDGQRRDWVSRLARARIGFTRSRLEQLSTPAQRVLLAANAAVAFPVSGVRRGSPPEDRGGVVEGVTRPIMRYPVSEPEVYLSVITEVEGRLESINAWDASAGISLGPIQVNAQRGALFRFLWQLWERDRELFRQELGTPLGWSMRLDGDHADLVLGGGSATETVLHGRGTEADVQRNYRYLQSGTPGGRGFDPAFRRRLAERFRNLVVWPHVQELIVETTVWWLQPGLDAIHAEGIGPVDPRRPDRDTFVLKAMLLSAYVRFSGCLRPLLQELRRWRTPAEKLANWETALSATSDTCRGLRERLTRQPRDAERVAAVLDGLGEAPAGESEPSFLHAPVVIVAPAVSDRPGGTVEPARAAEADQGNRTSCETETFGGEAETVVDEAEALSHEGAPLPAIGVPVFSTAKRARVESPLLDKRSSAAAAGWNQSQHPGTSGVQPAEIRTRLDRYVDLAAVSAAVVAYNASNPSAAIELGTAPVDAVFVEAAHQFQRKVSVEARPRRRGRAPADIGGTVGESTLDSLELTVRSGMQAVDRPNAAAQGRLRRAGAALSAATGSEFTAENWFNHMVNPFFLGWPFNNGVHTVLMRRLRVAEQNLLALPQYAEMTPVELAAALGMRQRHGGARPASTSASMHTLGLAVDVNYTGNPWVAGQHVDRDRRGPSPAGQITEQANRNFSEAVNRAALLISGERIDFTAMYLSRLSAQPTTQIYDVLAQRDRDLRAYLRLTSDAGALRAVLVERERAATADVLRPGETVDAAVNRWGPIVTRDLSNLRLGATRALNAAGREVTVEQSNFTGRDPCKGFLNLSRDLVVALRDAAGLAWGAVDFGAESGDVMHFDCRKDGVGALLNATR